MEETIKQHTNQRDYDKDPIVIEDYNYIFLLLFGMYFILYFIYLYIYNPNNISEDSKFIHFFVLIPLFILPGFKDIVKTLGKRRIKITNDCILFMQEENNIEKINIEDVKKIYKTYHDYYHKTQSQNNHFLNRLISIVYIPIYQIILIISKFFFHIKMDGIKSYHFFDSIIVFSTDSLINILPTSLKQRREIETYFNDILGVDINKQKIFYKFYYNEDEINKYIKE